jgi:hypothetical protein
MMILVVYYSCVHREASVLSNEIPEESGQFRFLHEAFYVNIKGSVGLILVKVSVMRISIPLDLSSRPFIPLPAPALYLSETSSSTFSSFPWFYSFYPVRDLLWVQITQSYSNRLRFSSLPCLESPCHTVIDPVFKEGFFPR